MRMRHGRCRRSTVRTLKGALLRLTRPRIAIDPVGGAVAGLVATKLAPNKSAAEANLHLHMTLSRTGDLVKTPAERLAHEEYERAEKRRQELVEQSSDRNPPEIR